MGLFQLRAGPGLALAPAPAPARRVSCRAAAAVQQPPPAVRTVAIPYADLKERGKDLSASIEAGFGPDGLGIVSVSGVPSYPELRKQLLRLAPRVANLPDDVKKELEDVESRYHIGWSYGKVRLESGEPDTLKGSFYANPIFDIPTANGVLVSRYPSYCRPNMWPSNHLPELEVAFKALGRLMLEVGLMLAHHCDRYGKEQELMMEMPWSR